MSGYGNNPPPPPGYSVRDPYPRAGSFKGSASTRPSNWNTPSDRVPVSGEKKSSTSDTTSAQAAVHPYTASNPTNYQSYATTSAFTPYAASHPQGNIDHGFYPYAQYSPSAIVGLQNSSQPAPVTVQVPGGVVMQGDSTGAMPDVLPSGNLAVSYAMLENDFMNRHFHPHHHHYPPPHHHYGHHSYYPHHLHHPHNHHHPENSDYPPRSHHHHHDHHHDK